MDGRITRFNDDDEIVTSILHRMFVTYCENRGLSFEKASNKAPFPRLITLIISEIVAASRPNADKDDVLSASSDPHITRRLRIRSKKETIAPLDEVVDEDNESPVALEKAS